MNITWVDIKGYEGYYQVNNIGDVRSIDRIVKGSHGQPFLIKGKTMAQSISRYGYKTVKLHKHNCGKLLLVHRLVGIHFVDNDNPLIKTEINHKNGDKLCNEYWNLEWCSKQENLQHARESGLNNPKKDWSKNKKPIYCNENKTSYESIKLCSEQLGLQQTAIINVLKGKWSHTHGYSFTYINTQKKYNKQRNEKIKDTELSNPIICNENGHMFKSISAASKETGIDRTSISQVLMGNRLTAGGYTFSKITKEQYNMNL